MAQLDALSEPVIPQEEEDTGFFSRVKDTVGDITFKDAATFVAEATPIIGDAMAAKEVYDELQKDDPNYLLAGALGGAAIIGLIPGVGDAAAAAIKAGARKALGVGKRIEVDPDALGSLGGNIRLKPKEEVTPQMSSIDYQKKMSKFDEVETADDWQTNVGDYVISSRDVNPTIRTPELEDSAKDLLDGKITREQHLDNVDKYKPVEPWDALPREPSSKATVFSLKPDQRENGKFILPNKAVANLGVSKSSLKIGDAFNGRLDIPAYNRFDTWIVAGTSSAEKGVTHYAKAIHYKGTDKKPVRFLASQKTSEKIGSGEAGKTGYATVSGTIKDLDVEEIRARAAKFLEDPEWTQVGFDPRRQGGFYVRAGEGKHVPIREADEVIQIGPLVLAKNAKLDRDHKGFNEGGEVMEDQGQGNAQMEMELMLKEQVDPVSGNTAPLGSTPEEVRDDVPINASVGEFMINAQTVNYFGEEFFNNLQETAAEGWERIKSGEESFFRDDELEVAEVDDVPTDEVQSMAYGGTVRGYAEGDEITDEIANKEVPKPVGGGFGGYGGTGSTFTGFEMRRVKDPVTGRTKKIAYFNGRPLEALKSYVDVSSEGETEEAAPAAATQRRDDDRPDVDLGDYGGSFRDKNLNDWTDQDFSSYKSSITAGKEGKLSGMETGVLQTVGNLIIPGGGFALTALAKKANREQAEKIFKLTTKMIKENKGTREVYEANEAAYNTARNLNKETYPDMFGVGFLDGDKQSPSFPGSAYFKEYEKLTGFDIKDSTAPEPTKFDTISSAKGFLGGSERDSLNTAIRTGDQAIIRHWEGIDRLRKKQDAYYDAVKSGDKVEAARLGSKLSDNARAQADKYEGSVARSQKSVEEGGYGAQKTGGFFSVYETRKEQGDRQAEEKENKKTAK